MSHIDVVGFLILRLRLVLTHFSHMDLPILISRTSLSSILGMLSGMFHFYSNFIRTLLANSGDPDQTPRSVT